MFRTLRRRAIISHMLPLLLTLPLLGIALINAVERQVLLPNLEQELKGQAHLIAELTQAEPAVFADRAHGAAFVNRLHPIQADVKLLDPGGHLVASTDARDQARLGEQLTIGIVEAQQGQVIVTTYPSDRLGGEITGVVAPVLNAEGELLGIVRLTFYFYQVQARFVGFRYLVLAVSLASMVLGGLLGWGLAVAMQRPLDDLRRAVQQLAEGEHWRRLAEAGPQEIRRLIGAFNTLVDRLHSLEAARKQLLANLVHEIGRPLGALQSAVYALERGADRDGSVRGDLLAGMSGEIQRLSRLLDDLTGLHDRVLGGLELNRREVALGEWLPPMLAPWQQAAARARLHWESDVAPDLPALSVDADRLGQAIGNLLSNAIKYTPPGGTVRVGTGADHGAAWIQVSDTGPGMAAEEQQRIFEPFHRGPADKRFPQGMGLGLTIARDMILAHGGRLDVDSAPDQGSRFTLWLPRQAPPA